MQNFVVFHLFPVLNVPANNIRVTSGELGKSWDSALPRSGWLPWTLMSDNRNKVPPLRTESTTPHWTKSLSCVQLGWCFIRRWQLTAWTCSDITWWWLHDFSRFEWNQLCCCFLYFSKDYSFLELLLEPKSSWAEK